MATIHKYPLQLTEHQTIQVASDMTPLDVQLQNGVITLWGVVADPLATPRGVRVQIAGTGMTTDIDGRYVGTVQQAGYVWHVFVECHDVVIVPVEWIELRPGMVPIRMRRDTDTVRDILQGYQQ